MYACRRAGRMIQVGLPLRLLPAIPMARVAGWELELIGSHGELIRDWGGGCLPQYTHPPGADAADFPAILDLVKEGRLQPQALIERVVDLAEGARAIEAMDHGSPVGMTIVDPSLPLTGAGGEVVEAGGSTPPGARVLTWARVSKDGALAAPGLRPLCVVSTADGGGDARFLGRAAIDGGVHPGGAVRTPDGALVLSVGYGGGARVFTGEFEILAYSDEATQAWSTPGSSPPAPAPAPAPTSSPPRTSANSGAADAAAGDKEGADEGRGAAADAGRERMGEDGWTGEATGEGGGTGSGDGSGDRTGDGSGDRTGDSLGGGGGSGGGAGDGSGDRTGDGLGGGDGSDGAAGDGSGGAAGDGSDGAAGDGSGSGSAVASGTVGKSASPCPALVQCHPTMFDKRKVTAGRGRGTTSE